MLIKAANGFCPSRSKVSLQQAIQSIIGTSVGIRRYVDVYYFIERTWDANLDNGESIQITARDIWSYGINDYPHFNAMVGQISRELLIPVVTSIESSSSCRLPK
jgi:hypothetical protein